MKRVPIDQLEPGDILAADVKIHSNDPDVQYRLRIDEGRALTKKKINRMTREGVGYIFVRDPDLEDLDPFIVDENLRRVEDDLTLQLREIRQDIETSDNCNISVKRLKNSIKKLISCIKETSTMIGFTSLKAYNDYTAKHSIDVAKLSLHLLLSHQAKIRDRLRDETGASIKYTNKYMEEDLGIGALLHDLGKWTLPEDLLTKSTSLDEREWEAMHQHPSIGHDILTDQDHEFRAPVKIPAMQHHEQFGGDGYPQGLTGKNIHLYGRLTALSDVYSALSSNRPYRDQNTPNRTLEIMKTMQADHEHFDPELFEMFKKTIPPFPIGQQVVLSNDKRGVVSELKENPGQPVVRVLYENNERIDDPYELQVNQDYTPDIVN